MKHFLFFLFFIPCILFSQNKLETAKKNINKSTTKTNNKKNNRESSSSNSKDYNQSDWFEYSGFYQFMFEVSLRITLGVFIGDAEKKELNPYPYYYDDEGEYAKELSDTGRNQNLRLGFNYISNTISGLEFNVLYKPLPIIGFNASHIHLSEKNVTGSNFLDITNLSINYYRIRDKNFSVWWGIGATHIGNTINKLGASYNIGTEIYPFKPISIHLSWQESFINESIIGQFKSQLKYHKKNKTFFIGYHIYQITNQDIKAPSIGFEITL